MKKILALCISLLILTASTCKKESLVLVSGTYSGEFTVIYEDGKTHTNPVSVTFTENSYSSTASEDRFPAGGSGTFTLDKNSITFSDEHMWTADFDWALILNGKYDYQLKGSALTLTKKVGENGKGTMTYTLTKD